MPSLPKFHRFISHRTAFNPTESAVWVFNEMQTNHIRCAAVVSEEKQVIGVVSKRSLASSLDHDGTLQDYLSENSVVVADHESITHTIRDFSARPEYAAAHDLVVVDSGGTLIGLISACDLLRLQEEDQAERFIALNELLARKEKELVDIRSEVVYTNRRYEEMRAVTEQLKQTHVEYFARLSNEIRTPMTGILGMVDLLNDSRLTEDQRSMLQGARVSGSALLRLTQNVLEYVRLNDGDFIQSKQRFDPNELLDSCIESLQMEAEGEKVALKSISTCNEQPVLGDAACYQKILENLISQMINATSASLVNISLREQRRATRVTLIAEITSPGKLTLEPFSDRPEDRSKKPCESGLFGTLIARHLVHRLRGVMVRLDKNPSCSGFRLEIPFTLPAESIVTQTRPAPELLSHAKSQGATEGPIRALVVDDNSINLDVARRILLRLGCDVLVASGGRKALGILKAEPIDCVFLDCEMPDLDGFEVCRKIRAGHCGEDKAALLITAMTAHVLPQSRHKCSEAGMDYFIAKPITLESMDIFLDIWCERQMS